MTGLDLKDVTKRFGDTSVIQRVNLTVEPGEFCVFVGPSGCGKSTLLRMIAGLEGTSSGTIAIGGRDMTRVDPADRGVAMVFQSYALYPHLTVAENMGYSLRIARKPKAEISRMKEFYKGYAKDPKHYSYTPEGNLRITLEGKPEEIIPLQPFSSLKSEEIDAIDKAKMELIEEVESEYEDALKNVNAKQKEAVDSAMASSANSCAAFSSGVIGSSFFLLSFANSLAAFEVSSTGIGHD